MNNRTNKETIKKQQQTAVKNKDKNAMVKQQMVKEIQEKAKQELMPALKTKMEEVTNYIVERMDNDKLGLNTSQVMSLIARRSIADVASGNTITYTPQEIGMAFNYYLDMVDKINQVKKFPPTIESFCLFLGVTVPTYNNWLVDPDKKNTMDFIHSYLIGAINTSTLTKEVEIIAGIYTTKTMGKIEQQAPTVVEYKKTTDIDTINAQLNALKGKKIIEAEYEEK